MKPSLFHTIKQDKAPEILRCIVEIPQGTSNKYEYRQELGVLELDRVLYGPNFYPANYADVPGTWNKDDGDPMDAVIFSTYPIQSHILVQARVVGLMEMIDTDEIDHKILCVPCKDPRFDFVQDINDLPEWKLKDLKTFMETYKIVQVGPDAVRVPGFKPKKEAYKFIEKCLKGYAEKFGETK